MTTLHRSSILIFDDRLWWCLHISTSWVLISTTRCGKRSCETGLWALLRLQNSLNFSFLRTHRLNIYRALHVSRRKRFLILRSRLCLTYPLFEMRWRNQSIPLLLEMNVHRRSSSIRPCCRGYRPCPWKLFIGLGYINRHEIGRSIEESILWLGLGLIDRK